MGAHSRCARGPFEKSNGQGGARVPSFSSRLLEAGGWGADSSSAQPTWPTSLCTGRAILKRACTRAAAYRPFRLLGIVSRLWTGQSVCAIEEGKWWRYAVTSVVDRVFLLRRYNCCSHHSNQGPPGRAQGPGSLHAEPSVPHRT